MNDPHLNPAVRHDFVMLFDVTDGNPNGDPDGGDRPRTDMETNHGLVSNGSLKRKIRDTVAATHRGTAGYELFVARGAALNAKIDAVIAEVKTTDSKLSKQGAILVGQKVMCARYFDVRMFGAVLSTGKKGGLGSLRGPWQLGNARSIDPVNLQDHAITRVVTTVEDDSRRPDGITGTRWTVPYGLYRVSGHYSAALGGPCGVTAGDLAATFTALTRLFEDSRSATRASMAVRGLWVFSHDDALGRAQSSVLLESVKVPPAANTDAPRAYTDYTVTVPTTVPEGITLTTLVNAWA